MNRFLFELSLVFYGVGVCSIFGLLALLNLEFIYVSTLSVVAMITFSILFDLYLSIAFFNESLSGWFNRVKRTLRVG